MSNTDLMPTFKTREAQAEFFEAYRRELESWKVAVEERDLWSADFTRMFALALRAGRIQVKLGPRRFTDEELSRIAVPTLVLLGDKESIYPPSKAAHRAQGTIPDVTTIMLSDCAHVIPIDAPEAATRAIRSFACG